MGAVRKMYGFEQRKNRKKKEYERIVEHLLREYPLMLAAIQDAGEWLPSCVSLYGGESGGYSEYRSTTEKFGILRAIREKEHFVNQIEKALAQLSYEERRLVELKYFDRLPVPRVCFLMAISETTYKRRRRSALRKIARLLNII